MSRQFIIGLVLFIALILFADTCVPWHIGNENGIFEILQSILLVIASFICIAKSCRAKGRTRYLWIAGTIFCLLMLGRELSWGRVFFPVDAEGKFPPIEAIPYGPFVHPTVKVLLLATVILLIRGRLFTYLRTHKLPWDMIILLVITIVTVLDADKIRLIPFANDMLVEEMGETYAYAVFVYLLTKLKAS
ncbi:MAG: hypothetical protein IIU73_04115 [Selenomonadales bacterium]|nr:hypothetical protein [Selenomonadales bacterium]